MSGTNYTCTCTCISYTGRGPHEEPTLRELLKETEGLTMSSMSKTNFYLFGLALEIEETTLADIYGSKPSDRRVDVFGAWKRQSADPGVYSWQRLVCALLEIKQNSIAGRIASTHGEYTCRVHVFSLHANFFLFNALSF